MTSFKKSLIIAFKSLSVLILILLIFSLTPWGKVFAKSVLLIPQIWTGFPVKPLNFVTKQPYINEELIAIDGDGRPIRADIYRPSDSNKHPTAIFVMMGINPSDKLVVDYAKSFARVGFAIVVPRIDGFLEGRLNVQQVNELVLLFENIRNKEFTNKDKIGFIGICAGGSYSLLAAQNPDISENVAYILTVSPYYDLNTSALQILSQKKNNGELKEEWIPSKQVEEGLDEIFLSSLNDTGEREKIRQLLKEIGKNDQEIEPLSPDGQKIYSFLTNRDSGEFETLWQALPNKTKETAIELSPKTNIKKLNAKEFILNDPRDTFIPSSESINLKDNLSDVEYIKLDLLEHSQLTRRLPRLKSIQEVTKLFVFVYKVLLEIG